MFETLDMSRVGSQISIKVSKPLQGFLETKFRRIKKLILKCYGNQEKLELMCKLRQGIYYEIGADQLSKVQDMVIDC